MPYYRVCPFCGSNLDPGEICDCKTQDSDKEETAAVIPTAAGSIALVAESRIQYAKRAAPDNQTQPKAQQSPAKRQGFCQSRNAHSMFTDSPSRVILRMSAEMICRLSSRPAEFQTVEKSASNPAKASSL